MNIRTHFDYPPLPIRSMDWSAIDADTYDADFDSERGFFSTHPVGHGATEAEAIADLLEQIDARSESPLPFEATDKDAPMSAKPHKIEINEAVARKVLTLVDELMSGKRFDV